MFLMKVIRINGDNAAIRTKQGGLPNPFGFSTRISNPNPYKTSGRFIRQSTLWKPRPIVSDAALRVWVSVPSLHILGVVGCAVRPRLSAGEDDWWQTEGSEDC